LAAQSLDDMWGGILDRISIDLVRQIVVMDVRVPSSMGEETHKLSLKEVSDLRFRNSIPGPWDYVELTEIRALALPGDRILISALLWSEDASIAVEAKSAEVDGGPLDVAE
jgi:hypothetical protein